MHNETSATMTLALRKAAIALGELAGRRAREAPRRSPPAVAAPGSPAACTCAARLGRGAIREVQGDRALRSVAQHVATLLARGAAAGVLRRSGEVPLPSRERARPPCGEQRTREAVAVTPELLDCRSSTPATAWATTRRASSSRSPSASRSAGGATAPWTPRGTRARGHARRSPNSSTGASTSPAKRSGGTDRDGRRDSHGRALRSLRR